MLVNTLTFMSFWRNTIAINYDDWNIRFMAMAEVVSEYSNNVSVRDKVIQVLQIMQQPEKKKGLSEGLQKSMKEIFSEQGKSPFLSVAAADAISNRFDEMSKAVLAVLEPKDLKEHKKSLHNPRKHHQTCNEGFCNQSCLHDATCNGGVCLQVATVNATCLGGFCAQPFGKHVSCNGGGCYQVGAISASCSGGYCNQIGCINCSCLGGHCNEYNSIDIYDAVLVLIESVTDKTEPTKYINKIYHYLLSTSIEEKRGKIQHSKLNYSDNKTWSDNVIKTQEAVIKKQMDELDDWKTTKLNQAKNENDSTKIEQEYSNRINKLKSASKKFSDMINGLETVQDSSELKSDSVMNSDVKINNVLDSDYLIVEPENVIFPDEISSESQDLNSADLTKKDNKDSSSEFNIGNVNIDGETKQVESLKPNPPDMRYNDEDERPNISKNEHDNTTHVSDDINKSSISNEPSKIVFLGRDIGMNSNQLLSEDNDKQNSNEVISSTENKDDQTNSTIVQNTNNQLEKSTDEKIDLVSQEKNITNHDDLKSNQKYLKNSELGGSTNVKSMTINSLDAAINNDTNFLKGDSSKINNKSGSRILKKNEDISNLATASLYLYKASTENSSLVGLIALSSLGLTLSLGTINIIQLLIQTIRKGYNSAITDF